MEIEPHRHRLYSLWEDFLQKMDHPDHCARLLDSFIDIVFQAKNVDWRRNLEDSDEIDNYRKQMAKIIRIRAPNIVILDIRGHADILHPTIGSGSIVVPQCWADRWDRAMDFEPDSRLALALEAYLKVVIVHQLAHWLSASEGPHTLLESFHSLSLDDTAKSLGFARGMDPGYYVEMVGGGGIVSFDEDRDDIYFQPKMHVGCGGDKKDESSWSPPTKFLLSIWKKGYDFFTRGPSYTMMELENRMMLTTSIQVPAAVSPI